MKVRLCILYFPRFHRGRGILPRNLRWNLKMMVSKRNLLFQGLHFRFHVKFRGVHQISFSCFMIHVCRLYLDLFFRCSRTKDVLKHFCIPFPRAAVRIVHTSTFSQSVQKFGEVGVKLMIVLDFIQLPYMPCLLSATHIFFWHSTVDEAQSCLPSHASVTELATHGWTKNPAPYALLYNLLEWQNGRSKPQEDRSHLYIP